MDEEESLLSGIDSEELNNLEEEFNSDERAMQQFLDELHKYRQKVKKKAKQNNAKLMQTKNSQSHPETARKKRKRHKLFDPHPPPKNIAHDDAHDNENKKVLSRKEYNSLIRRLTAKKEDKKKDPQINKQKDAQKNSQIFTNLYNQSIEAEKKREEMKKTQSQNEEKDLKLWAKPKTCRQSKVYAHNRMMQYVKAIFENDNACSKSRLLYILTVLGLENTVVKKKKSKNQSHDDMEDRLKDFFENGNVCQADDLLNILKKLDLINVTKKVDTALELSIEFSDSQKDNSLDNSQRDNSLDNSEEDEIESKSNKEAWYSIINLKKFYLEVANDQISTQFHGIAKEKLLIAMANEKRPLKIVYDPNKQFTTAQSLTRETLDRLVSSKRQKSPEIVDDVEKEEFEPIKLSEGSKKILNESTRKVEDDKLLCTLPIDERERHLVKIKNEKIDQMKKEFQSQLTQGRILSNPFPQYSEETNQMLAKYKEEKKNYVEPQPPYRPTLTKYEDFVKQQEILNSTEFKPPPGWDKDILRHRKAYDNFIHLKRLKTEGIDYILECRINARAQQKGTTQSLNTTNKSSKKNLNANTIIDQNLRQNKNKATNHDINVNKDENTDEKESLNINPNINDDLPQRETYSLSRKDENNELNEQNNYERAHFYFQNNESDDADMED